MRERLLMQYTTLQIGDKEYKLRLTGNTLGALEKKLNDNPLNVLMEMQNGSVPMISKLILILHGSLQKYHHGMTEAVVNDLYDDYVDSGKSFADLISELMEVLKVSGFLPRTKTEENGDQESQ
jgi:hypothetical protein